MRKVILDILFVVSLILIFIPIFRFSLDIGFFVLGISTMGLTVLINKKGGNDD